MEGERLGEDRRHNDPDSRQSTRYRPVWAKFRVLKRQKRSREHTVGFLLFNTLQNVARRVRDELRKCGPAEFAKIALYTESSRDFY